MASSFDNVSMALFCDFENVALGVRDAKYEKFDIKLVLERLLLKGSIVVKKAYCDWERYKGFKAAMHEANFELIEIPHVRQSGKNSADIRLVVDALDLCYTKSHVNTFVIISGDSDFSPLVSKLRENAKQVIGVGVQRSTSDLLTANCDEFIFYDDLVRESQRAAAKREAARAPQPSAKRAPDGDKQRKEDLDTRKTKAIEIAVQTFDALASERGDSGKIWASVLKNAIKRRKPDFNETYYGFRAFGNLLEEAQARGLFEVGRDEKSGTYVYRNVAAGPIGEAAGEAAVEAAIETSGEPAGERASRGASESQAAVEVLREVIDGPQATLAASPLEAAAEVEREPRERGGRGGRGGRSGRAAAGEAPAEHAGTRGKTRTERKPAAKQAKKPKKETAEGAQSAESAGPVNAELPFHAEAPHEQHEQHERHEQREPHEPQDSRESRHEATASAAASGSAEAAKAGKTARKSTSRGRRPRKGTTATTGTE
ncbi:NYN domain-containing protein [Paraburkholderia sp. SARCC-3016]|uniref:NYN domain-containing protein n=1 Tax=Paraburkholderia sp. SARCC-3016 TaxID=3058611 RepID=UPI00280797B7|nr:NYN domain-containing protein [Paraburkholderia sp. SARCC-3016]MDQ7975843.1 NYN domain-containing protein [Paraburkholderia sp. SARCC-3016]